MKPCCREMSWRSGAPRCGRVGQSARGPTHSPSSANVTKTPEVHLAAPDAAQKPSRAASRVLKTAARISPEHTARRILLPAPPLSPRRPHIPCDAAPPAHLHTTRTRAHNSTPSLRRRAPACWLACSGARSRKAKQTSRERSVKLARRSTESLVHGRGSRQDGRSSTGGGGLPS